MGSVSAKHRPDHAPNPPVMEPVDFTRFLAAAHSVAFGLSIPQSAVHLFYDGAFMLATRQQPDAAR